jgi:cytidylate kinase
VIVAIDGPAGSGKSTVARTLAARLRFNYLDTGAMYRCVALAAIERWGAEGAKEQLAEPLSGAAIGALASGLRIELGAAAQPPSGEAQMGEAQLSDKGLRSGETHTDGTAQSGVEVRLDGRDVSEQIRTREVSEMASAVAAVPSVRAALVAMQKTLVAAGDWVAEGRDVGTVIAPYADLKVFLTADPGERARRRSAELGADPKTVLAEQAIRDARDSGREHSPLKAAPDAVKIDTTAMSVEDVVQAIAALARARA